MNIQEVAKQAVDIVMRYYNNDIQPFLDACDEDVLWIGPAENQIIRTREALVAAFAAEKNDLRFVVHDLKVIPIPTTNSHVCEIILVFTVDTIWPDGSVNRVRQRIQLTVTERRGTIRLRVCHISNAIVYDERDTIYPIHYESNYKKFMLAGEQRSERVQIKSISKALLFLNSSQILYVETARSHTVIHTVEEDYESVESLQTLMNRYPDLDTSEALIRLASHHVLNALTNVDEEQMKEVPIEKLIKETNGLIRAAAYKKRIEVQNKENYEAGLEAVQSMVFETMAKDNPELYRQVSAYLNKKKSEGMEG